MMPRLRVVLAGAFLLLGLSYLGRLFIGMADAMSTSGSGGVGAVSAGCAEAILETFAFPIPIIATQVALKIAERKALIGTQIRRWHAIGTAVLVVLGIVVWRLAPLNALMQYSIFVLRLGRLCRFCDSRPLTREAPPRWSGIVAVPAP